MAPRITDAQYHLILVSGQLAQAARALLAGLAWHGEAGSDMCRICGEDRGQPHDPLMPCGQLQRALDELGPAVRAVTLDQSE